MAVTVCSKGHGNLKKNTTFFKGLTMYHCPTCNATRVEGETSQWVTGDPSDPAVREWLVRFANEELDRRAIWAEITNTEFSDPRWEVLSSW
jgi:transposase-like protein